MKMPNIDVSGIGRFFGTLIAAASGRAKKVRVPENVPAVLYAAVFVFFLALFLFSGFPGDSLERRIISEMRTRSPVPVFAGEARLRGVSSLDLRDVRLEIGRGKEVRIERARVRAGVLSLLFSDVARVSFSLDAYGGKIRGKVSHDLEKNAVAGAEIDVSSVEASEISGLFLPGGAISVRGKVDGKLRLSGEEKDSGVSRMDYDFSSDSLSVGIGEIKGMKIGSEYGGLAARLRGSSNRFETRVESLSLANRDFSLESSGKVPSPIRFRKGAKIDLSLNLNLFSDKAKLAFVSAFLNPREDGSFFGRVEGTLSRPRLVRGE